MPRALRTAVATLTATVALQAAASEPPAASGHSFRFFEPTVHVTREDVRRLDAGDPLVRLLPSEDGEIGVFAAVRTSADGPRLVEWVRAIAQFKKSEAVAAIARFSDPPRLGDLEGLALDERDLEAVRECKPGDCAVKLTADEISSLRGIAARAGRDWRPAVQDGFRRLVLTRVRDYLAGGHAAVGPYADRSRPVSLPEVFGAILGHLDFLNQNAPELSAFLERYPDAPSDRIESFLYWSKERLGGKPTVSATQVAIVEPGTPYLPEAIVGGKQIFATHYTTGSLGVTAIIRGRSGAEHYLAYLNRSRVDALDRWFGWIARSVIERRLKSDADDILRGLRARLETGPPPEDNE